MNTERKSYQQLKEEYGEKWFGHLGNDMTLWNCRELEGAVKARTNLKCGCKSRSNVEACAEHVWGDKKFVFSLSIQEHWDYMYLYEVDHKEPVFAFFTRIPEKAKAKGPLYIIRIHELVEGVPELLGHSKEWIQTAILRHEQFEKSQKYPDE